MSQQSSCRQSGHGAVGILCHELDDPYSAAVMHGAAETLQREGFHALVLSGGFPSAPCYLLENGSLGVPSRLEALIVVTGTMRGLNRELESMAAQSAQVMVSIGAPIPNLVTVAAHDEPGISEAVAHLVTRHRRKRIAFIAGPVGSDDGERRMAAYRLALGRLKLPSDPALLVRGDYEAQSGHEAALQLCRLGDRAFDAIVAANDLMAIGAIEGLRTAHLRVPEDVSVIGFDDVEEASFTAPALTTVRQPVYEQGMSAASLVGRRLRGEPKSQQPELIPAPLVVRRSCGCNPVATSPSVVRGLDDQHGPLDDALRGLLRRRFSVVRAQRELSRLDEELATVTEFQELASVMTRAFRSLNMQRFLLCVYTADQREAKVVLESTDREVLFQHHAEPFPVAQLLPHGFLGPGKARQVMIEPLALAGEQFGYMAIEADLRSCPAHPEFRYFVSTALSRIARKSGLDDAAPAQAENFRPAGR